MPPTLLGVGATLALSVFTAFACRPAPPADGDALIRQMQGRYDGKWYRTLTFVQKTTFPDGRIETWYEAARLPGLLRIDIAPLDSGRAILFRNDSIYQAQGGQLGAGRPMIHPLLVLGFDVYADRPERTAGKLRQLGFDLTKLRADTWQGRPVWVVGADAGDDRSSQFWIDQERLVFVRLIQTTAQGAVSEIQFNRYEPLGEGWIAPEVRFFTNGDPGLLEEYREIRADVTLPDGLFDPDRWGPAGWIP